MNVWTYICRSKIKYFKIQGQLPLFPLHLSSYFLNVFLVKILREKSAPPPIKDTLACVGILLMIPCSLMSLKGTEKQILYWDRSTETKSCYKKLPFEGARLQDQIESTNDKTIPVKLK